jgi:hypothetical protein
VRSLLDACSSEQYDERCPDRFIGTLPYAQHHGLIGFHS